MVVHLRSFTIFVCCQLRANKAARQHIFHSAVLVARAASITPYQDTHLQALVLSVLLYTQETWTILPEDM